MTSISTMVPTKDLAEVKAKQAEHLFDDTASAITTATAMTSFAKLMPPPPKPKAKAKADKRKAAAMEENHKVLEEVVAKQAAYLEDDTKSVESGATGLSAVSKMIGPVPTKSERGAKPKAGKRKVADSEEKEGAGPVQEGKGHPAKPPVAPGKRRKTGGV
eukprot:TRINITY_DN22518_c0_g1_i1.p2 TRINITY_DN22518_c0_g1~~TRINITY_DN22518_c0_g1_i1.p2  ORF type:complete len:177 (+),score=48.02 TRINITY_DN22518_c0_g1_i1:52-531(+)